MKRVHPTELPGLLWSRFMCRTFDRHNVYCRGRTDHTKDQRRRTK